MDSNILRQVLERVRSKDFTEQCVLWGSAATVSYLAYWYFLGIAAQDDRRALEHRLIQVMLQFRVLDRNRSHHSYRTFFVFMGTG